MYKKVSVKKLGMRRSHRDAVVNNQLRTLFSKGILNTTTPKAKVVKAKAESLVASIKKTDDGDINLRRKLQIVLGNDSLVKKALEYGKKESATVTYVKVGFRSGDNAEVSRLELAGMRGKKARKSRKVAEEKEPKSEKQEAKGMNREDIEKLGKKSVKKAGTVSKERARTRSGL